MHADQLSKLLLSQRAGVEFQAIELDVIGVVWPVHKRRNQSSCGHYIDYHSPRKKEYCTLKNTLGCSPVDNLAFYPQAVKGLYPAPKKPDGALWRTNYHLLFGGSFWENTEVRFINIPTPYAA